MKRERWIITGTGTGVGKTLVTRGLTLALRATGTDAVAIKPYETGCEGGMGADARDLARASEQGAATANEGWYRARAPLAPWAATLAGEPEPPRIEAMTRRIEALQRPCLIEGAGGVAVPLDATHTTLDLFEALAAPLILVARNTLGTLSHTLTAVECLRRRRLRVQGVVLNRFPKQDGEGDPSVQHNATILERLLDCPVIPCTWSRFDDAACKQALQAHVDVFCS